jgi:predicted GH43/DUF377 family glycosyl hydrolase
MLPTRLQAEPGRVVIRPFQIAPALKPGEVAPVNGRARRIVDAVLAMDGGECAHELARVTADFGQRHWQTRQVFLERYEQVRAELGLDGLSEDCKELIGAYFCHEYSYTSAALMNPSIVPHPDQSGLTDGALRVVLSLRAVGEGHISSIAFREGILRDDGGFDLLPQPPFSVATRAVEMPTRENRDSTVAVRFEEASLSGTVIFPFTDQQRNGLEDLRLVKLAEGEDGGPLYCGTYTAYSGHAIQSELLITHDFKRFRLQPLAGPAARNKGMALFPRKIDGRYAMIGRQDGENLFYMTSDDLLTWGEGEKLITPVYPWELVQMGNCGSPIEIEEGWLLLTHGVGAMRKYSIGAVLLDKDDPRKVIGRTTQPILSPSDEDREGYVPNVVYTCGGIAHGGRLFLPFAVADSSVTFCWVDLDELVAEMREA